MELVRELTPLDAKWRGGSVTVGNFDGVHRGHLRILSAVRDMADRLGGPAIVFTFDPHPLALLNPTRVPPPLTWLERKAELLAAQSIDLLIAYPTDFALLELTGEAFYQNVLRDSVGARGIVEGPNFRFGKGRDGDVSRLAQFCKTDGIELHVVEPVLNSQSTVPSLHESQYGGTLSGGHRAGNGQTESAMVSSTRIRQWLLDGNVEQANRWLTAPFRLRGVVMQGDQRGRELGFPTANLGQFSTLVPGPGVYVGEAWVDGTKHRAAIHVGPNSTFNQVESRVEVHLLDFDGNLYGKEMLVDFGKKLREGTRFESVAALVAQMTLDVEQARRWSSGVLEDEAL